MREYMTLPVVATMHEILMVFIEKLAKKKKKKQIL